MLPTLQCLFVFSYHFFLLPIECLHVTMIIVHSENSTTQPEWHPNAVQRGTWAIYQTCVITIFLCVWTTIHMNIPRPYEKSSRQTLRKIAWSLLTIIAPEFVALNAWFQYRDAKDLLGEVNESRPRKESGYRRCLNMVAFACFAPLRLLDWLRISRLGHLLVKLGFVRDRDWKACEDERAFDESSDLRREGRAQAAMEDANLTWTMDMAFYVLSGGCVYRNRAGRIVVLERSAIIHLSKYEPSTLLKVPQVVWENPGKANTISKAITCVQALWFCTQCITRTSQGLAVSLLELNTFSHCISALLIYIFWWHKPYDVDLHVYVESASLDLMALINEDNIFDHIFDLVHANTPFRDLTLRDRIRYRTFAIFDENGSCLLKNHILDLEPNSKLEIPDTRFYLASNHPNFTFNGDGGVADRAISACQRFWRAWLDTGRPVPIEAPHAWQRWLSSRTLSMSYLDLEYIACEGILGHGPPTTHLRIGLFMTITFALYGGLHLLAWQYSFKSKAEQYMWQTSTIVTMSTGLILPTHHLYIMHHASSQSPAVTRPRVIYNGLSSIFKLLFYLLVLLVVLSRAFLVIESFIALPNSPPSTYVIPTWSAYIPHI